jgi:hypothetical protein
MFFSRIMPIEKKERKLAERSKGRGTSRRGFHQVNQAINQ